MGSVGPGVAPKDPDPRLGILETLVLVREMKNQVKQKLVGFSPRGKAESLALILRHLST